jgi:hypothetical protein
LADILAGAVAGLKGAGLEPFVVPAMGSHGGGTAERQLAVLHHYGVTEEHVGCPVRIGGEDCNRAFAGEADVVILVTSAYRSILRLEDFGRGTVVCDASAPPNVEINGNGRSDVFLYHGGVARLPFALDPGFDIGLAAPNTMYGCMTEGILTAVDPALPGSWGRGNITLEKLRAYLGVLDGASAGVTVEFSTGDRLYSSNEIKEYESTWRRFRREAPREGREKS